MKPEKRSITIAGHATSVSLEPVFWDALRDMAAEKNQSVPDLIRALDADIREASPAHCGSPFLIGRGSPRVTLLRLRRRDAVKIAGVEINFRRAQRT